MNKSERRRRASLGGQVRAAILPPKRRKEIARSAAQARWWPPALRARVHEMEARISGLEGQIERMSGLMLLPQPSPPALQSLPLVEHEPLKMVKRVVNPTPGAPPKRMVRLQVIPIERAPAGDPVVDRDRPRTRGECVSLPRPCPFVGCRYHLYLDVSPSTGAIKLNFPHLEVWEMKETCALDVADRGAQSLEGVGEALDVSRERVRQIERDASRGLMRNTTAILGPFLEGGP